VPRLNTGDRHACHHNFPAASAGTAGDSHAFLYRNGEVKGFHAFVYRDGQMLDLGHLGGGTSVGYDINDRGQVVGESGIAADSRPHAFLYSDGEMRDLGTLGGSISTAYAINATGQITGSALTSSSRLRAFLHTGGRMEDLGVLLEGGLSIGRGINSSGWVVGFTDTETGPVAFVHDGTKMHDLNALIDASGEGWIIYNAYDVNDAGAIAAVALRGGYGGSPAPVLLTQVSC
jgi:probable HAF family extracellular repeat protein